jgi:hypothetical protein
MLIFDYLEESNPQTLEDLHEFNLKVHGIGIERPKQKPIKTNYEDLVHIDAVNREISKAPVRQRRIK